jgi:galactose oxidase
MTGRRASSAAAGFLLALGVGVFATACEVQESPPSARTDLPYDERSGGSTLNPIDLVYVCGNKFLVTNSHRTPVQVTYRVAGTRESGALTLREGLNEDPAFSETELETRAHGPVEIFQDDQRVARRINGGIPCGAPAVTPSLATAGSAAAMGEWPSKINWPIVAVHLALLPTGKVLSFGKNGVPQLWDPVTNTFTDKPSPSLLFCAGQAFMSDGRLLVAGGHLSDDHGLPNLNFFDPFTESWTASDKPMAKGRWYPTVTTLGNGQMLTIAGRDQTASNVLIPEVWTGTTWRALTTASMSLPYYPRMFLAPNGKVFMAGEGQSTFYLSTGGTGSWSSSVGNRMYGTRDYGAAVMYRPGKILYVGGGSTTNTAEIIDLNQLNPSWQWTGSMAFARRHLNATVLPTGDVLVTGGTSGTSFSDETQGTRAAELWNPNTGVWTTLASDSVTRVYHATSILLPDARVLHTGSGDGAGVTAQLNAQVFSPPYLFKGVRPIITSAPSLVGYGQSFFIGKTDTVKLATVSFVRLGATTHAFDENQRFARLPFSLTQGGLTVTAPTSRNRIPPGHYMLFLVSKLGVPSVASIIRIN